MKTISTKKALAASLLSLLVCVSMLVGSTFAWFTDTAKTGVNTIQAGTLDVQLLNADGTAELGAEALKWVAADGREQDAIFWEPGCSYDLESFRIKNNGNLALKYKVVITGLVGDAKLLEAIDFTVAIEGDALIAKDGTSTVSTPADLNNFEGTLAAGAVTGKITITGTMKTTAGNEYMNEKIEGISITVYATQDTVENDSNNNEYDKDAQYSVVATTTVTLDADNKTTTEETAASADKVGTTPVVKVTIPVGVTVADSKTQLTLTIDETALPDNFQISATDVAKTLEVKLVGLDESNETPIRVELYVGAGMSNFQLYHHSNLMNQKASLAAVTADQDYYYDRTSGVVTLLSKSFSPFTYTCAKEGWGKNIASDYATPVDTENKVVTIASAEELALFASQVNSGTSYSGYTVKLVNDIDLGAYMWNPIGKSGMTFQGIFDGQGHTISNLLIRTPYASDVGLFGFTTNGEIKNFTLNNASVTGYLDVGAIAGTPYTSKYTNITLTGDVAINGYAYVGGMFGKNAYANLTDLTIDVTEGSYVNADSKAYRTYVGGLVGFMGEGNQVVKNVTSNIDVIGSTCDVGGITGIAHYGNTFINCHSSGDVTLTSAQDEGDELEIGGIAGVWLNTAGQTVTLTGCTYTGTLSSNNKTTGAVTEFACGGLVGNKYNRESADGTLTIN